MRHPRREPDFFEKHTWFEPLLTLLLLLAVEGALAAYAYFAYRLFW